MHIHGAMNGQRQIQPAGGVGTSVPPPRRDILVKTPQDALDAILDAPDPAALVRSFPEQDLFLLVHEIGQDDALELLSLASFRQWEHILDIEAWDRDRLSVRPLTHWLSRLMMASPSRLVEWFLTEETDLIEYYMFRNMMVFVRQHDQDPSDFGQGLFTLDDTFYIDFRDDPAFEDEEERSLRDAFLTRFLEKIAEYDYATFHRVMLEHAMFIPAAFEEEAYRLRTVRLAEKGFLPVEEATAVYRPLKVGDLKTGGCKIIVDREDPEEASPAPVFPTVAMGEDTLFSRALGTVRIETVLEQLQTEFAGLSNQIIAADGLTVRSRDELKEVVAKACGYISIGLEALVPPEKRRADNAMAALIKRYPLARLFRLGYGKALSLKWRAQRWRKGAWFTRQGLPLSFWDEDGMGIIGGLLLEKPLFFDNYRTGVMYREFASLAEIQAERAVLDNLIALDDLLGRMALPVVKNRFITYKKYLLTVWARQWLGLSEEMVPIDLAQFKRFYAALWTPGGEARRVGKVMKGAFLDWLAANSGRQPDEITASLGPVLEALFDGIESEYGAVAAHHLDPRWTPLFWVQRHPEDDKNDP